MNPVEHKKVIGGADLQNVDYTSQALIAPQGVGVFLLQATLKTGLDGYDWGKRGLNSLVARLASKYIKIDSDLEYAELWIGAHPKGPAMITVGGRKVGLNDLIARYPEVVLGKDVIQKFGQVLPFLIKVLSIDQSLSIQSHPDDENALRLHQLDPVMYPDFNHKPEIALAITELKLLIGFKPWQVLQETFVEYPELRELLSPEGVSALDSVSPTLSAQQDLYHKIYTDIIYSDTEFRGNTMQRMIDRIVSGPSLSERDSFLIKSYHKHGAKNFGLPSSLLMNFAKLSPGEAFYIGPNTLHAYLEGDIIECMSLSDFVLRAGLTTKPQHPEALVETLWFGSTEFVPIRGVVDSSAPEFLRYPTPANEFLIETLSGTHQIAVHKNSGPHLIFCREGGAEVETSGICQQLTPGDSVLITALDSEYTLRTSAAEITRVSVPKI